MRAGCQRRHANRMARLPRLDLRDIPQHGVQRGNNRLPCFLDDGDRPRYLQALREALMAAGMQLHTQVLMDNHVQLLATPAAAGDIGRLVQRLGASTWVCSMPPRSYRHAPGGCHPSCLVDRERHLLTCRRYIECRTTLWPTKTSYRSANTCNSVAPGAVTTSAP